MFRRHSGHQSRCEANSGSPKGGNHLTYFLDSDQRSLFFLSKAELTDHIFIPSVWFSWEKKKKKLIKNEMLWWGFFVGFLNKKKKKIKSGENVPAVGIDCNLAKVDEGTVFKNSSSSRLAHTRNGPLYQETFFSVQHLGLAHLSVSSALVSPLTFSEVNGVQTRLPLN